MSDLTPTDLRTLLAAEFDARGWEYDLVTGRAMVERAERDGQIDPAALARAVPSSFLRRTGATRDDIQAAIEYAAGGRALRAEERAPATLLINDNRYQLHMAEGASISGSQVNVGGTQINVRADTDRAEVLAGIGALVRAGLEDDWNVEALVDLADTISDREDISYEDVEHVVVEVAEDATEHLDRGRIRRMMQSIAEQTISGALAIGLTSGLTEALALLAL